MLEIERDLIEVLMKYKMDVKQIRILFSPTKQNILEIVFEDLENE